MVKKRCLPMVLILLAFLWMIGCGAGGKVSSGPGGGALSISSVSAASSSTGAIITWTTNASSDSQVEYGTTTAYGQSTPVDSTLTTSHQVSVSGLSQGTQYHFRVKSHDAAGDNAIGSDSMFTTLNSSGQGASPTMTISNQSGSAQSSYPISIPRVFRAGDIPHFAQVVVNGNPVLTQCDVKNRWPDGSLKFAIVSFVIPTIAAAGPLQIAFQDQSTGNNTGFLDVNGMLNNAYDFEGVVQLTGAATRTISARTMLNASNFSYWLQGPIVTAVIIEDRANRTFDTNVDGGAGNPLHPIFEAWFYPQNHKVEIGYTIENTWISNTAANSTRDQTYSFTLCAGNANCSSGTPSLALSQASFTHIGFTRWHRSYWIGGAPPSMRLDFNSAYTTSTKAVLNWDYTLDVSQALATYQSNWNNMPAAQKTIPGTSTFEGDINKYINGGGAQTWIGPQTSWDVLYLLTFDDTMRDEMLTNADLMGRWPMHFREADHFGGSGKFFDHVSTGAADTGVDPEGRVVSVNARPTITLYNAAGNLSFQNCGGSALDIPSIGPITIEQWAHGGDTNRVIEASHEPDIAYFPYLFTGKYYYLEELQFQAAKESGFFTGCTDRHDSWGLYPTFELRALGWAFRQMTHAAFISPDGTSEQAYFSDKLQNNIAFYEGTQGLPQSYPAKSAVYNYGTSYSFSIANNKSPLSVFAVNTTTGYESSTGLRNCGNGAMATFQEGFFTFGLAMAREAGFKSDTLMQALAHRPFNVLKNPAVNHFLNGNGGGIEAAGYVNCFRDATTTNWISSWSNFNNYYTTPLPTSYVAGDIEGDWALIGLGAIGTMYGYNVDGYDAGDVYRTFQGYLPYANPSFATVTPKFNIRPRQ